MTTCSSPVYPPAVIQAVTEQMDLYEKENKDTRSVLSKKIPEGMQLKPCMTRANLSDAVVSAQNCYILVQKSCLYYFLKQIKLCSSRFLFEDGGTRDW